MLYNKMSENHVQKTIDRTVEYICIHYRWTIADISEDKNVLGLFFDNLVCRFFFKQIGLEIKKKKKKKNDYQFFFFKFTK